MNAGDRRRVAEAVLARYPRSYAEQLGIRALDTPSPLFRLLVMALLMSARIRASVALNATRALFDHGWTTPRRLADATWEERTAVLNEAGYARYDERTSRMLGETCRLLLDRYHGDLRTLREQAGRDPGAERRLLTQCKGIGDVGVDIFFREVQRAWGEVYPFADARALRAAGRLHLGDGVRTLTRVARGEEFVRLVNALVQVDLHNAYDDVMADAG